MIKEIEMPHWPPAQWGDLPGEPLERMERLLAAIDNPHHHLPPVVHVAGTNGKGSTIAFMRAVLEAAGYKVHVYTSPHIHKFEERITLASQPVSAEKLNQALEICRLANEEQPIGFFEGTTAAALYLFSKVPADILLLETGIGGRADPTNIIDEKRLCILTTISADHGEHLGSTLTEIANHKAGIMRNQTPVVIGFQPPEVMELFEKEAEAFEATALCYGKHWAVQKASDGFIYADGHGQIALPTPALKGPHQFINAGCAIAALSLLEEFEILGDHIAAGLKWVHWPGRLERMQHSALSDQGELWFDGGHNMAAGHMLAVVAEEDWNDKPLYVVFGTTRGKDVVAMLQPLMPFSQEIFVVPVLAEPRCYTPHEMCDQAMDEAISPIISDSVADAIAEIAAIAEGEYRILVFGSVYLRLELADNS